MSNWQYTVFLKTGKHIRSKIISQDELEYHTAHITKTLTGKSKVLRVTVDPQDSTVYSVHIPGKSIDYVSFTELP